MNVFMPMNSSGFKWPVPRRAQNALMNYKIRRSLHGDIVKNVTIFGNR